MIHHIVLFKLRPGVTPDKLEEILMQTRIQLLKIPVVLNIRCGKRIHPDNPWEYFLAADFASMEKLEIYREDPIHVKFIEEVIKPYTCERQAFDFETEPGKDVRFS